MKTKGILGALLAATVAAAAFAGDAATTSPGWEKLKTLVGEWEGTGDEHSGKAKLTYRLLSNGSSLEETMETPETTMVTMYAPDHSRIVATHYCASGNQPRMAAKSLSGNTLDFEFLDATNVSGPDAHVMRTLEVRFEDADHLQQVWTSRVDGKDHVGTFSWVRRR
jgi:hypothetical protein